MSTTKVMPINKIAKQTAENYERVLCGPKSEFVVSLDEAFVYCDDCSGKRRVCYRVNSENSGQPYLKNCLLNVNYDFIITIHIDHISELLAPSARPNEIFLITPYSG
jgi:hypothetical protein